MKRISFILALLIGLVQTKAAVWQWSVPVTEWISNETNRNPDAFLWVPEQCDSVKAVMFAFQNMNEETLFEMESWRKQMADMDVAIVWIAPGFGQEWDVNSGCQKAFDKVLEDLAQVSGYKEIATAPLIPFGHSAQATMPWNFAAWNPDRVLCIISYHGDSPRTNLCGYGRANVEWGRNRNIDGIPGLMIEGEYEWWYDRVRPALAFRMMYPKSCISFLGDTGRGHFDVAEETADYMAKFIEKSFEHRLSSNGEYDTLIAVDPEQGWLAEQWMPEQTKRSAPAPYKKYKGDPHEAFWYFDQEMAQMTEQRYADTRGKKPAYLQFVQNGELLPYDENLHVRVRGEFTPDEDGLTYYLKAIYTDSTRTIPAKDHPSYTPKVRKVCGPVKVINDTTFRVDFNCTGMDNPRRTWDMTLCAEAPSDKNFKGAVQQIEIKLPHRITNGKRQAIMFPSIDDVVISSEIKECAIELNAISDSGLPVSYYVKEGPAYIGEEGNKLVLTEIPPKSKMPMKVTVVAWQFGKEDQVQTADPVERTFYITK